MATPDFTKMVPGFDFLQSLMKGAGSSLPSMSQWIAPTLDAERGRQAHPGTAHGAVLAGTERQDAVGATIQALEVQRMTLATLKTMNLPMGDLRESMKLDPRAFMPKAAEPAPEPAAPPPRPAAAEAPLRRPPPSTRCNGGAR
jgi:hypothetical protein